MYIHAVPPEFVYFSQNKPYTVLCQDNINYTHHVYCRIFNGCFRNHLKIFLFDEAASKAIFYQVFTSSSQLLRFSVMLPLHILSLSVHLIVCIYAMSI